MLPDKNRRTILGLRGKWPLMTVKSSMTIVTVYRIINFLILKPKRVRLESRFAGLGPSGLELELWVLTESHYLFFPIITNSPAEFRLKFSCQLKTEILCSHLSHFLDYLIARLSSKTLSNLVFYKCNLDKVIFIALNILIATDVWRIKLPWKYYYILSRHYTLHWSVILSHVKLKLQNLRIINWHLLMIFNSIVYFCISAFDTCVYFHLILMHSFYVVSCRII